MSSPAQVWPEVLIHGDGRLFEGFKELLLNLLLLAVAADEVADELAGRRVGAAFDAGLDVAAEGFGERDVHAGLRHGCRMADNGILCQYPAEAPLPYGRLELSSSGTTPP